LICERVKGAVRVRRREERRKEGVEHTVGVADSRGNKGKTRWGRTGC
jgi:hypothetical protein